MVLSSVKQFLIFLDRGLDLLRRIIERLVAQVHRLGLRDVLAGTADVADGQGHRAIRSGLGLAAAPAPPAGRAYWPGRGRRSRPAAVVG